MAAAKRLVIGNWKMNPKTLTEAKRLFTDIKKKASAVREVRVVVCPPVAYLSSLKKLYVGKNIFFGAQDVHYEKSGAHTGSHSVSMLKSIGASHIMVGHSDRRAEGESNEDVQKKIRTLLDEKVTAILCVGEIERDHGGQYLHFVKEELVSAFRGVAKDELKNVVVVYEPIWAIGKSFDSAVKPHDVHQMVLFVRKVLTELFDREAAMKVPVLYGGSVEPANSSSLFEDGEVNGFLVGHASLDSESFLDIVGSTVTKR